MAVSAAGRARSGGGGKAGSRSASPGSVCSFVIVPGDDDGLAFLQRWGSKGKLGSSRKAGGSSCRSIISTIIIF